jgi:hypothetical protein
VADVRGRFLLFKKEENMGGNSPTTQTETPVVSGFPAAPGSYTMQPAPPGFIEALAAQLQAGYGGDQRAYLDTIYRPMTFPSFHALGMPVAAPAAAPAAPAAAPAAGRGASGGPLPNVPIEQLLSRSTSSNFGGMY